MMQITLEQNNHRWFVPHQTQVVSFLNQVVLHWVKHSFLFLNQMSFRINKVTWLPLMFPKERVSRHHQRNDQKRQGLDFHKGTLSCHHPKKRKGKTNSEKCFLSFCMMLTVSPTGKGFASVLMVKQTNYGECVRTTIRQRKISDLYPSDLWWIFRDKTVENSGWNDKDIIKEKTHPKHFK